MHELLDEATEFILKYSTYTDRALVRETIARHLEYKTFFCVLDPKDKSICAVCRFNIAADLSVADIFDIIIREDFRHKDLMREMLMQGIKMWPVKFLRFERGYDDGSQIKPKHIWSVERFLRRKA